VGKQIVGGHRLYLVGHNKDEHGGVSAGLDQIGTGDNVFG